MLFQLVTLLEPVEAAQVPYLLPSAGEVNSAREDVFPPLSPPHMAVRFFCAGFDIGSIKTRHETSTELSS